MKQIEVFYNKIYKSTTKKIERDIYWYDTVLQKMNCYKTGQLDFEYKYDESIKQDRMIPVPKEIINKKISFQHDKEEFDKWLNEYSKRYDIDILRAEVEGDNSIILDIPEDEFNDFTFELDEKGYRYIEI